jgi:hypothetical protein
VLVAETVAGTRSLTHLIAANEGSGVKALIARSADAALALSAARPDPGLDRRDRPGVRFKIAG